MEEIIEEIPLTPLEPAKIYVHHYDKNTKEYLYKEEAEIDKQATKRLGYNVHLLPAYSTLKLVPEFGENEIPVYSSHTEQQTTTEQIPVYDEETGEIISYEEQEKITDVLIEEWTLKPDYRKNFYKVDDNLNVLPIDTIGEQEGFYLVDKSTGDLIKENPDKYKISDGNVVAKTDEEYLQEQAEEKQARIQNLYMTRSDFFDATIRAFGADEDDLLTAISGAIIPMSIDQINTKIALNNYKNALNFYRKHPLFTMLSNVPIKLSDELTITITPEQWDKFFDETNKGNAEAYKELITANPQD